VLSLHADLCVPDLDVMIFSVGNGDGEGQNPEDEEYRAKQSQTLHASKLALGVETLESGACCRRTHISFDPGPET